MEIIQAPGVGRWYPSQTDSLRSLIKGYYDSVTLPEELNAIEPVAGIAPHAGYMYCGEGNAYAYKVLSGKKIRRIIVIGPSHYRYLHGAFVPTASGYHSPLGDLKIDIQACLDLAHHPLISADSRPFTQEHSVDNQIPFLQFIQPQGFLLLPLIVGELSLSDAKVLAELLKPYLDSSDFIAVSSDFTHYGANFQYQPFPNDGRVRQNLEKLDRGVIEPILAVDAKLFDAYIVKTGATVCGRHPINLVLSLLADMSVKSQLLHYYCSGDREKDYSLSVSYASVLFYK